MRPTLKENQIYRAVIEGYASDGSGVARIEGMAVFVRGAIRDEVTDIRIEHVGHSAAWGHAERVTKLSMARREPDCPYYGTCGGCQFRHMNYAEELEAKRTRVEDALRRIGGVTLAVSTMWDAADQTRYRNKVQFPVSEGAVGYYRAGTHQVVDIADCLLQPETATACRAAVKAWMEEYHVSAYDEKTGRGLVRHLYLRTNQARQALCCLVVNGRQLPHSRELVRVLRNAAPDLVGLVLCVNTKKTNVILGTEYHTLWGQDWLEETLCGHTFQLSVPSFFQINRTQTEVLYNRVMEFAALTGTETVVDLYCGIGTISLTLAEQAGQVIGVEVVPQAVADARENAVRNGLADRTRFECGDAADLAAQLEKEGIRPHVVVVDPPRKGLAGDVVDTIARMGPDRVVYVSCDPATLARDVKRFSEQGYESVRAEAVDLFPRTAHVETVVLLSHKKPDSYIHIDVEFGEGEGKIPVDKIVQRAEQYKPKERVTYKRIKEYILEKYGFKVHTAYIAEVKRSLGLPMYDAPNAVEKLKQARKHPTPEKVEAIKDALHYFAVI